jgi:hypothetical protein
MSSKSFLFFFLLIVTGLRVKSQTLLNANFSKIRKEVESQGGGLTKGFIEKNIEMNGRYKKVVVQYPLSPEGNSCLMKTTFCLTLKNKCFKYYEDYWGEDIATQKIDEIKKYYSGLKRVKNELKWIDNERAFEVNLIPKRIGNNKFASVYILEYFKI